MSSIGNVQLSLQIPATTSLRLQTILKQRYFNLELWLSNNGRSVNRFSALLAVHYIYRKNRTA